MPRNAAVAKSRETSKAGAPKIVAKTTDRRSRASHEFDSRQARAPDRNAQIALEGPAGVEVDAIEVVEGPDFKSREKALLFMEDKLVILIHADPAPKPEDPVYIGVNGRGCYVFRDKKTLIPRKYVERLARARADSITQDVEARDPEAVNRLRIASNQRYPFSVLHDPNPKGAAWLQQVLTS